MTFSVKVQGASQVEQNAKFLPLDARRALVKEKRRLAKNLAAKLRRAVISGSKGRMGSKVRPTIHQTLDRVTAGPHEMLIGTEFGARGRYGWYGRPEFAHSVNRQFKPRNASGYWWHPTIERSKPEADAAVQRAVDETVRHWG